MYSSHNALTVNDRKPTSELYKAGVNNILEPTFLLEPSFKLGENTCLSRSSRVPKAIYWIDEIKSDLELIFEYMFDTCSQGDNKLYAIRRI